MRLNSFIRKGYKKKQMKQKIKTKRNKQQNSNVHPYIDVGRSINSNSIPPHLKMN